MAPRKSLRAPCRLSVSPIANRTRSLRPLNPTTSSRRQTLPNPQPRVAPTRIQRRQTVQGTRRSNRGGSRVSAGGSSARQTRASTAAQRPRNSTNPQQATRGRGRPSTTRRADSASTRKANTPQPAKPVSRQKTSSNPPQPVKRGRGRPRKSAASSVAPPAQKRGRGRPPKATNQVNKVKSTRKSTNDVRKEVDVSGKAKPKNQRSCRKEPEELAQDDSSRRHRKLVKNNGKRVTFAKKLTEEKEESTKSIHVPKYGKDSIRDIGFGIDGEKIGQEYIIIEDPASIMSENVDEYSDDDDFDAQQPTTSDGRGRQKRNAKKGNGRK